MTQVRGAVLRSRQGITEEVWRQLPEERKFAWKLVFWSVTFLAAIVITKTGNRLFDWLVGGFAAATALLFIESQRSFSRWAPRIRKRTVRAAIAMTVCGTTLLGVAFFAGLFYSMSRPMIGMEFQGGTEFDRLLVFVLPPAIFAVATLRVFRQLQMEELINVVPRVMLKRLLVDRPFIARNFFEFALFELSVTVLSSAYCSSVARLAIGLLEVA